MKDLMNQDKYMILKFQLIYHLIFVHKFLNDIF